MEHYVARDSGAAVYAKHAGTVVRADATGVIIRPDRADDDSGRPGKPPGETSLGMLRYYSISIFSDRV